ncbi:MAG: hypothetical protein PUF71_09075 [Firmicutes bacterium]|nr:hypothetical protein [Bacillota bacterium]
MKKLFVLLLSALLLLGMGGCGRTMDDVIANEPSFLGIVTKVTDRSILVSVDESSDAYRSCREIWVSLDVEMADSMTHFSIGDQVVVYYDGMILETSPGQVNTVYAILLRTPADRESENKG